MRLPVVTVVLGGLLVLLATAPSSTPATRRAAGAPPALPRVTLISDSVAGSISFDIGATSILSQGIDLFLEPGEGRLLGGESLPGGVPLPTALELIDELGQRLGPTVIMCVGYNDLFGQYSQNVSAALAALHAAGVKHVLWATLHVSPDHTSYETMNAVIEAAAAQDPSVTVVDWNAYSADHPEWFQPDGVHLTGYGPRALATLFHASLVKLGIPAYSPPASESHARKATRASLRFPVGEKASRMRTYSRP